MNIGKNSFQTTITKDSILYLGTVLLIKKNKKSIRKNNER